MQRTSSKHLIFVDTNVIPRNRMLEQLLSMTPHHNFHILYDTPIVKPPHSFPSIHQGTGAETKTYKLESDVFQAFTSRIFDYSVAYHAIFYIWLSKHKIFATA